MTISIRPTGDALNNRSRVHFDRLTRDEQIAAVYRLSDEGFGDYSISAATGWAVEQVREILGQRRTGAG